MMPVFGKDYRLLAYRLLGGLIRPYIPYFDEQKPLLKKAGFFFTIDEYVSVALFTSALLFPFAFLLFYLLFFYTYEVPFLLATVAAMPFAFIVSGALALTFIVYPSYKVDSVKRDMNARLPYAVTHMATIAGTGVPPYVVFKLVGDFFEYGEIAKECRRIARNIEVFGYDTITALTDAAAETPSSAFKDMLWGVISTIRSGGDMRLYLMEKAKSLMDEQRRVEAQYIESLSILSELYTTVFVAGPILFVIMVTIMGMIGGLPLPADLLLSVLIYLLMPIMSVFFMVLVDGSKPAGAT